MIELREGAAHHRQAAVIVVVTDQAGLAAPHRKYSTGLFPFLDDRRDVEKDIGVESARIFPILGVVELRRNMGRAGALQRAEPSIEDRVAHDSKGVAMILVPASAPVRN